LNETIKQNIDTSREEYEPRKLPLLANSNVLQSYLISVKQLTGAVAVSLFFQSKLIRENSESIFHEGKFPRIAELKTKKRATIFIEKIHQQSNENLLSFFECADNNEYIIRISIAKFVSAQKVNEFSAQRRKLDVAELSPKEDGVIWLGFRYESERLPLVLENIKNQQQDSATVDELLRTSNSLIYSLSLGGYMAWQHYKYFYSLQDPVSQLPGRIELQTYLKRMLDDAFETKQPLTLIFINPDEFAVINQRFDREKGDQTLAEISEKLVNCLRSSDALFRYGGAIFTALLPHIGSNDASKVAEKLRRSLTGHPLNSDIRLTFSIGVTVYQADAKENRVIDVAEFLAQADQALNRAKLSGGGCVVEWGPEDNAMLPGSFDRLSGIFTADTEKDYRNMQLLWETITVISSATETEAIATEFVNRIAATFKLNRVALFDGEDDEKNPHLIVSSQDNGYGVKNNKLKFTLTAKQLEIIKTVKKNKRLERVRFSGKGGDKNKASFAYAVPLIARENYRGVLYIDGLDNSLKLDSSDLIFLNALATQVALALDRAELALQWKQEKERESQKLRKEVRDLRKFVKNARLVYRSAQMESLLETLRTVAPTDITILITGESGTGKEVLAQTLHEYSDRKNKPLITVDCGAISQNLIESELFGHVKGAFTGAQNASEGRIVNADGGTLLLDEVGELPLDVQAKLLRFVQEKQITPVGGTKTRQVDVRILAATNRDLAVEVAEGRFRGDLYYRFKVVTIKSPALRERPDDILPLAQHFLENFSLQYQKGNLRFSADAERALLEYPWPGNVRELQNTMIRAVVLSNSEIVGSENLQFSEKIEHRFSDDATEQVSPPVKQLIGGVAPLYNMPTPIHTQEETFTSAINTEREDPWQQLRYALNQQLTDALNGGKIPVPLGKWLNEDLVLAASEVTNGNARRAAIMLGLAETTFRRQLEKVNASVQAGLLVRTSSWSTLLPILNSIINSINLESQQDIIGQARLMLLEQVLNKVPQDNKKGAALMGVTGPTYRRLLESLAS